MSNLSISFEDILDDCISAIQEQEEAVADCLAQYPEQREMLEPLMNLVIRLQAARTLESPPEFRRVSAVRMRNWIAAHPRQPGQQKVKTSRWRRKWQRIKIPALAFASTGLLALFLLSLVLFSAGALPGDTLYPVKRSVEQIRLATSLDNADDAELQIRFAAERLEETAALAQDNRLSRIEQSLADYVQQFDVVVALFGADSGLSSDERATLAHPLAVNLKHDTAQFQNILILFDAPSPLSLKEQVNLAQPLAVHLATHITQLTTLMSRAPASAQPSVELTLANSMTLLERALSILGDGEIPTAPPVSGDEPQEETATPTLPPTASPTATSSPAVSPSPTRSATPPSLPPTTTWTPAPTATPSPTGTSTPSPLPSTATSTSTGTATPSPLPPTMTPTLPPIPSSTNSPSPTGTVTPSLPPPTATPSPPDWTPSPGPPDVTMPAMSPPTRP